ncbi:MAG: homoserine kinase [Nitrososphaerales archaeon]|nr:homoserine kinase [Nitrososphaerales archaeon]
MEAPASSANLGPGFDIFALSLREPRDRLTLERAQSGVSISVRGSGGLPETPDQNVAGAVARAVMADQGIKDGVSMLLTKGVPVGAGLGSSAASSVAAAAGTSALFGLDLQPREIIRYAGLGERLASGTAHYDNVTASYAGGFVIVGKEFDYVKMEPPRSLALCLVTPNVELPEKKTKYARSLLPRSVSLKTMVDVTRAASLMVHGFATGDIGEIGKAMAVSPVDEARAKMIPGFERVRKAGLARGATGVCISGAGPTVLAVSDKRRSQGVVKGMVGAFRSGGIESSGFITRVGGGCRVAER